MLLPGHISHGLYTSHHAFQMCVTLLSGESNRVHDPHPNTAFFFFFLLLFFSGELY